MRFSVQDLVITKENEEAFRKVLFAAQQDTQPQFLFLEGPSDSGKTTLMVACGTEKNLLSTKRAMYCHAAEILLALRMEANVSAEEHLSEIGEADVLFLDNLDAFLNDMPLGPQACKALLSMRKQAGLTTIVSAHMAKSSLTDPDIAEAVSDFEVVTFPSITKEGRVKLLDNILQKFNRSAGKHVNITPETKEALANSIAEDACEIEPILERIVANAPDTEGFVCNMQNVRELLA